MKSMTSISVAFAISFGLSLSANQAYAQSAEEFFDGRQIRVIVGAASGGGYDTYARILARHLGRHLPRSNATFVVQNMPAAGSMVAMNHLYTAAEKDGSVLGAINPGSVAEPLMNPNLAKYDPRLMRWIGSIMRDTELILAWHTASVDSFDKLFETELLAGSTGGASAASVLPRLINSLLGTKIKLVEGYKSAGEIILAMERGEVEGYGSSSWSGIKNSHADHFRDKRVRIIAQYGLSPHPDLQGIPTVIDRAKTAEQKEALRLMLTRQEIGRPFVLPPGAPEPIVAAYRVAFNATMKDPVFIDEIQQRKLELNPLTGQEIEKLIAGIYSSSPAVVENVRRILAPTRAR